MRSVKRVYVEIEVRGGRRTPRYGQDDWLAPLREDYWRRIFEVLHRLATLFEEQKEYAAAIPCADRLVGTPVGAAAD